MPIQTDTSVSPYFDDYIEDVDYYKILFKPSTAVQVRELNQLQTILQRQIEEFGDHILKRGTLLDGCQMSFDTEVPFVKIKDITVDGAAPTLSSYIGLLAKGDNQNVISRITEVIDGFESQDPDLKTLYLEYIDSGTNEETRTYQQGEVLTIYNTDLRLFDIDINSSPQGFSNGDTVVLTSAIEVQNTTGGLSFANGGFTIGDTINQSSSGANLVITSVSTTANTDALVLGVRPEYADLAGGSSSAWELTENEEISASNTGSEGVVTGFVGSGAIATMTTTPSGVINTVDLTAGGSGYYVEPHVSVLSSSASVSQVTNLNLSAQSYIAKVTVATKDGSTITSNTTGVGYGMSVTDGTIYQNGQFLRVGGQSMIVEKYANTPSDVAVGFRSQESIIDSNIDRGLLDNAAGYLNENAPGADRLKIVPTLTTLSVEEAEDTTNFFSIVKFSEGKPYSQTQNAEYSKLGDEMARRTYEESGNYVLDRFNITTRSTVDIANSDTTFSYIIDPGLAYINGYRVKTNTNFAKNVDKSKTTESVTNTGIDAIYGNYIRVNEFSGLHAFSTGQQISLRDTPADAITDHAGSTTAAGAEIGTARIRSVTWESGIPGTADAVYRLYLFDIRMDAGKNFKNVRSVSTTSSVGIDGIADIVTEIDPKTSADIAALKDRKKNSLIFNTNLPLKSVSNVKYKYRTNKSNITVATDGGISLTPDSGATFPYSGSLSTAEKRELILVPEEDIVNATSFTGTVTANNTVLTGSGTSFVSDLEVGDYLTLDDSTNTAVVFVKEVTNSTSVQYGPTAAAASIGSGASYSLTYPQGVPVPIANRSTITASVTGGNLLIGLDAQPAATANVSLVYNQEVANTSSIVQDASRKNYIKIQANTHSTGTDGPWTIGVSNVFRLRAVYAGSNTSATEITDEFYIDHNQNENYYGLSYLYQKPTSSYTIGADDVLLVEYDYFDSANPQGLKTINSFTINDESTLTELDSNSNNAINTLEIPEVFHKQNYYDLREVFDFRPETVNTVAITANSAAAPVNPAEVTESSRFSGSNLKFPVPEGDIFYDAEYYQDRTDTILLNSDATFDFLIGYEEKDDDPSQFALYRANIPAYPSLPSNLSSGVREILDKKIGNEKLLNRRRERFTIVTEELDRQTEGYSMEEIAQLERRISILEYYATLSETEDQVKNKIIPSSVDASIERFKFGFFVDNFADYSLTDVDSPEINSSIYEFLLQPAAKNFNIPLRVAANSRKYMDNSKVRFPYTRKRLISQTNATIGPKEIISDFGPDPEPNYSEVCQFISNRNLKFNREGKDVYEDNIFKLTANTQADDYEVEIKFNFYGGNNLAGAVDRIEVYQASSPSGPFTQIANNSSVAPENLTFPEKRELMNKNLIPAYPSPRDGANRWFVEQDFAYFNGPGGEPKYWIAGVGKLSFNYNVSAGRYIRVRVVKGSKNHTYYICYPGDSLEDPIYNGVGPIVSQSNTTPTTDGTASPNCPPDVHEQLVILAGLLPDRCKPAKKPAKDPVQYPHEEREDRIGPFTITPVFSNDPGGNRSSNTTPTYSGPTSQKDNTDILFGMLGGNTTKGKLERSVDKQKDSTATKSVTGSKTGTQSKKSIRHLLNP